MFPVWITFLAGMGAGLGTGLAGLSAAAVITPMLIVFLKVPPYQAVGIALASDVLASGASAWTYAKNKKIDIKNGLVMMAAVLLFTAIGSYFASFIPDTTMGNFSIFTTFLVGLKFLFSPVNTTVEAQAQVDPKKRQTQSILAGVLVGLVAGILGAGGGMMILLILTVLLGYELKTAVGTSVFIMAFTALTGAVSHFVIDGWPNLTLVILSVIFTLVWALIGASFANKVSTKVLNQATGLLLTVFGGIIILVNFL